MFPSSNNPFTYTHESSFGNDENPSFSLPDDQEHDTPSPFLPFLGNDDELLDNHLFSQHQLLPTTTPQTSDHAQINALEKPYLELVAKKTSTNGGKKQTKARKRTPGKKDRHSKIYTAQGPRDRRMRLSLQIARKFFDLQDMLGFDKASKTIEWLFTKSKAAIKEVMGSLPHVKRSCSVFDIIKETSNTNEDDKEDRGTHKNERKCRNVSTFHPLSKDCRDKARARARERTREKMIRSLEKSKQCDDANPNYLEHFEVGEKSKPPSQDMNSPLKAANEVLEEPAVTHLLEHQMATVGIIDKFLGMGGSSTLASPSIQNFSYNVAATESSDGIYSNDDFLGFQGNWSMGNARIDRSDFCAILTDHIDPNSTGDVHQQQNPSSSFIIDSNSRSQSHFLGY